MAAWVIYALGGGWGHLTRGLALARALFRCADFDADTLHLLTNSRLADWIRQHPHRVLVDLPQQLRWHTIPPTADAAEVSSFVQRTLHQLKPATVIIDTFPRGLAGELADWLPKHSERKVLIHRRLNPRYAGRPEVNQAAATYDLVLAAGEANSFPRHPRVRKTPPWLICRPGELLSRNDARQRFDASTREPLIACVASGKASEQAEMTNWGRALDKVLGETVQVRVITLAKKSPTDPSLDEPATCSYWPAMTLHAGIDLLIGGGGYNTVHEARATGVPLLAVARPRLYDQQHLRLRVHETLDDGASIGSVTQRIHGLLATGENRDREIEFTNGVDRAAQLLTAD